MKAWSLMGVMFMITIICSPDSLIRNKTFAQTLSATKSAENLSAPAQHQVELFFFCRAGLLINWPKKSSIMFSLKLAIIPLQWFCCWKVLRQESSLSLQVPMAHGMNKKVTFSQVSRLLNFFLSNSTSLKIARGISNERSLECFENCKKHKCTFTASKAANKLICSQSWFGLLRNWHQIQPWAKAKMKSLSFLFHWLPLSCH